MRWRKLMCCSHWNCSKPIVEESPPGLSSTYPQLSSPRWVISSPAILQAILASASPLCGPRYNQLLPVPLSDPTREMVSSESSPMLALLFPLNPISNSLDVISWIPFSKYNRCSQDLWRLVESSWSPSVLMPENWLPSLILSMQRE